MKPEADEDRRAEALFRFLFGLSWFFMLRGVARFVGWLFDIHNSALSSIVSGALAILVGVFLWRHADFRRTTWWQIWGLLLLSSAAAALLMFAGGWVMSNAWAARSTAP